MWTILEWEELFLCAIAGIKGWKSPEKDNVLWSLALDENKRIRKLGVGVEQNKSGKKQGQTDLFFAKFTLDHNNQWHSYPVLAIGHDIPPSCVLQKWLNGEIIDKATVRKITKGQF